MGGLVLLTLAMRFAFLAATGITYEDSLISLRYARNLAEGAGLVFNPGERVFGASTPLWVLILAALQRLALPLDAAKWLSTAADGVTCLLWMSWLRQRTGAPVGPAAFGLIFALSPLVVPVTVSGMETGLALLFLTLALIADQDDRPWLTGLGLGLLMLTRPDGAIAAVVLLALRWHRTRELPWRTALVAGALVLPWIAIATAYYGTPIPNSIPAKAAAYNFHRPSLLPNLFDTIAQVSPTRGPWGRVITNLVMLPVLLLGLGRSLTNARLRPLGVLLLTWWLYLVVPKTLLFVWYYPLLVMPAFVLAALGADHLLRERMPLPRRAPATVALFAVLAIGLAGWLLWTTEKVASVQQAEGSVRRSIGEWLRDNTPENARIAVEPLGYIGYYSRRRLLDEVGLVSPEMVPLNRAGAGWFTDMLTRFQPDYIVERPGYLLRNLTINSRVPMYRTAAERDAFIAAYAPVKLYLRTDVPGNLINDYRFVIFRRRSAEERRAWEQQWLGLTPNERFTLAQETIAGASLSASSPKVN